MDFCEPFSSHGHVSNYLLLPRSIETKFYLVSRFCFWGEEPSTLPAFSARTSCCACLVTTIAQCHSTQSETKMCGSCARASKRPSPRSSLAFQAMPLSTCLPSSVTTLSHAESVFGASGTLRLCTAELRWEERWKFRGSLPQRRVLLGLCYAGFETHLPPPSLQPFRTKKGLLMILILLADACETAVFASTSLASDQQDSVGATELSFLWDNVTQWLLLLVKGLLSATTVRF